MAIWSENVSFKVIYLWIAALMIINQGCNQKNAESMTDITDKTESALNFARSYLGAKSQVLPNADDTYFLCIKDRFPMISFAVTDLDNKVILETQTVRGKVAWYETSSLIVKQQAGVIEDKRTKPSDNSRIIELKQNH